MLGATLLAVAASLPLGVWPSEMGPATITVHDVEFYLADPEDDYTILAVQPLAVPLTKAEPAELGRLAALADRLGADGVVLLGEMSERSVPDVEVPGGTHLSVVEPNLAAAFDFFDAHPRARGGKGAGDSLRRP